MRPAVLICLGGTAAQAVFDREVRVMAERGKVMATEFAPRTLITLHPSALLRMPDPEEREREYRRFVDDLALAL